MASTLSLTFSRSTSGAYVVDTRGMSEFSAVVRKEGAVWRAESYTFGGLLTSTTHRTLSLAREDVERVFRNVEPACAG